MQCSGHHRTKDLNLLRQMSQMELYSGGTATYTIAVLIPPSANLDMKGWDSNCGYYSISQLQDIGIDFGNIMAGARDQTTNGKEYQHVK